jgi:hypothetical protein
MLIKIFAMLLGKLSDAVALGFATLKENEIIPRLLSSISWFYADL